MVGGGQAFHAAVTIAASDNPKRWAAMKPRKQELRILALLHRTCMRTIADMIDTTYPEQQLLLAVISQAVFDVVMLDPENPYYRSGMAYLTGVNCLADCELLGLEYGYLRSQLDLFGIEVR